MSNELKIISRDSSSFITHYSFYQRYLFVAVLSLSLALIPAIASAHHISSSASTWTLNETGASVDFQYPLADIVILVAPENVRKQETYIQIIKPVDDALRDQVTKYLEENIPPKILLSGCRYSVHPLNIRYQDTKIFIHGELACEPGYRDHLRLEDKFLVSLNILHVSLATLDVGNTRLKCLFRSGITDCSPAEGQPSSAATGEVPWKTVMGKGQVLVFHGFEQWIFLILLILGAANFRSALTALGAALIGNAAGLLPLLAGRLPEPSSLKPLMPMLLAYGSILIIAGNSSLKRWTLWLFFGAHGILLLLTFAGLYIAPAPAIVGMALLGYGIIWQGASNVGGAGDYDHRILRSLYIFSALFGLEHGFVLADGLRNYNALGPEGVMAGLGFDFASEGWRYLLMAAALPLVAISRARVRIRWWRQALGGIFALAAVYWTLSRGLNLPGVSFNYNESAESLKNIIQNPNFAPQLLALSLILAVILGALHALTPGHGKTVVAAYLVGSKGRVIDAMILGVVVTVTHTSSVLLLGVVALLASKRILPGDLAPYLGSLSGVIIVIMGFTMLVTRFRNWRRTGSAIPEHTHSHAVPHSHLHDHEHDHDHDHHHDHTHLDVHEHEHGHEALEKGVRLGDLIALGISGGLAPCPDAFVVLLIAIAVGRLALGLVVILAFSLGLAAVLITVGILMVKVRPLVERLGLGGGFVRVYMPLASAFLVTVIGVGITYQFMSKLI